MVTKLDRPKPLTSDVLSKSRPGHSVISRKTPREFMEDVIIDNLSRRRSPLKPVSGQSGTNYINISELNRLSGPTLSTRGTRANNRLRKSLSNDDYEYFLFRTHGDDWLRFKELKPFTTYMGRGGSTPRYIGVRPEAQAVNPFFTPAFGTKQFRNYASSQRMLRNDYTNYSGQKNPVVNNYYRKDHINIPHTFDTLFFDPFRKLARFFNTKNLGNEFYNNFFLLKFLKLFFWIFEYTLPIIWLYFPFIYLFDYDLLGWPTTSYKGVFFLSSLYIPFLIYITFYFYMYPQRYGGPFFVSFITYLISISLILFFTHVPLFLVVSDTLLLTFLSIYIIDDRTFRDFQSLPTTYYDVFCRNFLPMPRQNHNLQLFLPNFYFKCDFKKLSTSSYNFSLKYSSSKRVTYPLSYVSGISRTASYYRHLWGPVRWLYLTNPDFYIPYDPSSLPGGYAWFPEIFAYNIGDHYWVDIKDPKRAFEEEEGLHHSGHEEGISGMPEYENPDDTTLIRATAYPIAYMNHHLGMSNIRFFSLFNNVSPQGLRIFERFSYSGSPFSRDPSFLNILYSQNFQVSQPISKLLELNLYLYILSPEHYENISYFSRLNRYEVPQFFGPYHPLDPRSHDFFHGYFVSFLNYYYYFIEVFFSNILFFKKTNIGGSPDDFFFRDISSAISIWHTYFFKFSYFSTLSDKDLSRFGQFLDYAISKFIIFRGTEELSGDCYFFLREIQSSIAIIYGAELRRHRFKTRLLTIYSSTEFDEYLYKLRYVFSALDRLCDYIGKK